MLSEDQRVTLSENIFKATYLHVNGDGVVDGNMDLIKHIENHLCGIVRILGLMWMNG